MPPYPQFVGSTCLPASLYTRFTVGRYCMPPVHTHLWEKPLREEASSSLLFPFHCWARKSLLLPVSLLGEKEPVLASQNSQKGEKEPVLASQNRRKESKRGHPSLPEREKEQKRPILASQNGDKRREIAHSSLPEREKRREIAHSCLPERGKGRDIPTLVYRPTHPRDTLTTVYTPPYSFPGTPCGLTAPS